ncbi:hypothetical protein PRIPAC_90109 [Pristionchus pacificus]|uniref:Uncharacterized protein n=1 Tax=Pristionchus pacificus TaxID=54126 RepID=A0A2A6CYB8_PRIPA|nr:hypothetical protein PRIPAC_90109 [Pristionchus pacificus]|eukprot:PDM83159.1 hypothetical protein PRIPAC_37552 [Pristionchus pacificus]
MRMAVVLLLFMFTQYSPGRRSVLNRTSVVDELHCKMLCYENAGVHGCAQHGPVAGLTCTHPTREMLRETKNCPRIDTQVYLYLGYPRKHWTAGREPISSNLGSMPCGLGYNAIDLLMPDLSHKVVCSAYYVGLAWDPELGVWYYLEIVRTYICGAACFSVPLADADALREDACAPLPAISGIPGYGPPSLFNRTWPCSHEKASVVKYELVNTKTEETSKYKAWINCVYGTWLYLMNYMDKYKQTRGITAPFPICLPNAFV